MLGRTADNIYWMARYQERAENLARLLGGLYRMSLLPSDEAGTSTVWEDLFIGDDERHDYLKRYDAFDAKAVTTYLSLDPENPSSILSCFRSARESVRATRHVLSTELWETANHSWLEIRGMTYGDVQNMGTHEFFEWVKERSHLFRGTVHGTMRRGEAYCFWQLGTLIERAENTARLLAARSDSFHQASVRQESASDFYQWGTLLRSVNAYKTYREIYRSSVEPRKVAELMILNRDMPRSLSCCVENICNVLGQLRQSGECVSQSQEMRARLGTGRIDRIFRSGVDAYLEEFRIQANRLGTQIQLDFMMIR